MQKIELTKDELANIIKQAVTDALKAYHPEKGNEFLTRNQAAKSLGVTLTTLYTWDKNGILPAQRLGKKVFYKASTIDNFFTTRPKQTNKLKGY